MFKSSLEVSEYLLLENVISSKLACIGTNKIINRMHIIITKIIIEKIADIPLCKKQIIKEKIADIPLCKKLKKAIVSFVVIYLN